MRKKYNYMLREGGARRGSEGLVGLGLYLEARVSIDPYLEARLNIKPAAARQVRSGDNTCRADGLNAPLGGLPCIFPFSSQHCHLSPHNLTGTFDIMSSN
jgi:hypothetical protein